MIAKIYTCNILYMSKKQLYISYTLFSIVKTIFIFYNTHESNVYTVF